MMRRRLALPLALPLAVGLVLNPGPDVRRGCHDVRARAPLVMNTGWPTSRHDFLGNAAVQGAASGSSHWVDYNAVRNELRFLMDNPSWDDGSLAPIFIRLAWHSSGTYDAASGTGGSNGAGMRFETEAADPENAGLHSARAFLEPVKKKFPGISYSDLWILAAYVGIEYTGGPKIPFRPGRVDMRAAVAVILRA